MEIRLDGPHKGTAVLKGYLVHFCLKNRFWGVGVEVYAELLVREPRQEQRQETQPYLRMCGVYMAITDLSFMGGREIKTRFQGMPGMQQYSAKKLIHTYLEQVFNDVGCVQ